jgi:hypothetical protein
VENLDMSPNMDTAPLLSFSATVSMDHMVTALDGTQKVEPANDDLLAKSVYAMHFTMGAFRKSGLVIRNTMSENPEQKDGVISDSAAAMHNTVVENTFNVKWDISEIGVDDTHHNQWHNSHVTTLMQANGSHHHTTEYEKKVKDMFALTIYHQCGDIDYLDGNQYNKKHHLINMASGVFEMDQLLKPKKPLVCRHSCSGLRVTVSISNVKTNSYDWTQASQSSLRFMPSLKQITRLQGGASSICIRQAVQDGLIKNVGPMGKDISNPLTIGSFPDSEHGFPDMTIQDSATAHEIPSFYTLMCLAGAIAEDGVSVKTLATTKDGETLARLIRTVAAIPNGDTIMSSYLSDLAVVALVNGKCLLEPTECRNSTSFSTAALAPVCTHDDCEDMAMSEMINGNNLTTVTTNSKCYVNRSNANRRVSNRNIPTKWSVNKSNANLRLVNDNDSTQISNTPIWSDLREGATYLDMSNVDINALHEYWWSPQQVQQHTQFLEIMFGAFRGWPTVNPNKVISEKDIVYTHVICALANMHNVDSYFAEVIGTASAPSADMKSRGKPGGHCFGICYQNIHKDSGTELTQSMRLSHPDISILEGTAPVAHEKLAGKQPLGLVKTNQLESCLNLLTSSTGVVEPDGVILAEMNWKDDNFIRALYAQSNRLCIDEIGETFGITMLAQCSADEIIGCQYAYQKATGILIEAGESKFETDMYFRMQARVALELRTPAWSKSDFKQFCLSKWYNEPARYYTLFENTGEMGSCTEAEYHRVLSTQTTRAAAVNQNLQSLKLYKQSKIRTPEAMSAFLEEETESYLRLFNRAESTAMTALVRYTDTVKTRQKFSVTLQENLLTVMKNMVALSPKPIAMVLQPCMGFIVVHIHLTPEACNNFLDCQLSCTRQLLITAKQVQKWQTAQLVQDKIYSLQKF